MRRWFERPDRGIGMLAALLLALILVGTPVLAESSTGGYLGVTTRDLDAAMLEALHFDGDGILIDDVLRNTPADSAGLKAGDIITQVNDRKIISTKSLKRALWRLDPGDMAKVHVLRDGKEKEYAIKVAVKPDNMFGMGGNSYSFSMGDDSDAGSHNFVFLKGDSDYGHLGVNIDDLNDQLAEYFGVKPDQGALIDEVVEDSPAEKAGLKAGDVILEVGGEAIHGSGDVTDAVRSHKKGEEVEIVVMRDKKKRTLKATLDGVPGGSWRMSPGMVGFMVQDALKDLPDLQTEVENLRGELKDLRMKVKELSD